MDEHPNVGRIREALSAYHARDFSAMAEFLADDIVWHVGGNHPLSGDYRGRQAVVGYFAKVQEATAGSLTLETAEILADDRFGGVVLRALGERAGKKLNVTLAEAVRFNDRGQWTEYWALANDQGAVDEFWR